MNLSSPMHQGAAHSPRRPTVITIEAGLNDLINHWQQLSQSAPECGKPHPGGAPTPGKDTYSHWGFLVKEILELIGPSSYQLRITSKVVDYVRGEIETRGLNRGIPYAHLLAIASSVKGLGT